MRVYLASQITGLSYGECVEKFRRLQRGLRNSNIEVFHPMTAKECLRTEKELTSTGYQYPMATNHAIFERDRWMVTQSDVVLVNMAGCTHVSIGMCMELAWASILGKHTVVILPPLDPHHSHAFVLEAADVVFSTEEDAVSYIVSLANSLQEPVPGGQMELPMEGSDGDV